MDAAQTRSTPVRAHAKRGRGPQGQALDGHLLGVVAVVELGVIDARLEQLGALRLRAVVASRDGWGLLRLELADRSRQLAIPLTPGALVVLLRVGPERRPALLGGQLGQARQQVLLGLLGGLVTTTLLALLLLALLARRPSSGG